MNYRYHEEKKKMYIDGHEREDTVQYRQEVFLPQWREHHKQMMELCECESSNHDSGCEVVSQAPTNCLILVTHDESTFYANNHRKRCWVHEDDPNQPQAKGEGATIMASVFLTAEDGNLQSKDECVPYISAPLFPTLIHFQLTHRKRNSHFLMKPGKGRDSYFNHELFLNQVKNAIDIFEEQYGPNAKALFAFDNAMIHKKQALNSLSAQHMPKGEGWNSKIAPEQMWHGRLPNGDTQDFYLPNPDPTSDKPGPFKGMTQILVERGFYDVPKLLTQCLNFKCEDESLSA